MCITINLLTRFTYVVRVLYIDDKFTRTYRVHTRTCTGYDRIDRTRYKLILQTRLYFLDLFAHPDEI